MILNLSISRYTEILVSETETDSCATGDITGGEIKAGTGKFDICPRESLLA